MFLLHLALVASFQLGRNVSILAGPEVTLEGPFFGFVVAVMAVKDAFVNVF